MSGKQIDVGKNAASIQLLHLGFLHVFASDISRSVPSSLALVGLSFRTIELPGLRTASKPPQKTLVSR